MDFKKRKQIRLKGYDYSQSGAYFITICTYNREPIFGFVDNGTMKYSEFGKIAFNEILHTRIIRKKYGISINEFVVMPNHIHVIIQIVGTRRAVSDSSQCEAFAKPTKQSIPTVVRAYKSAVTRKIREYSNGHGTPCPYVVWQARFHDHIIRNGDEYRAISKYVSENPLKWKDDCFYADC